MSPSSDSKLRCVPHTTPLWAQSLFLLCPSVPDVNKGGEGGAGVADRRKGQGDRPGQRARGRFPVLTKFRPEF